MTDSESEEIQAAEAAAVLHPMFGPVTPTTILISAPSTLDAAIQDVVKMSQKHKGLARGLHEAYLAMSGDIGRLCHLAIDCRHPGYVRMIKYISTTSQTEIIKACDSKRLGEWAGLCKYNRDGIARKICRCNCLVIKNFGDETTPSYSALRQYLDSIK